jgi:hypothetical protein
VLERPFSNPFCVSVINSSEKLCSFIVKNLRVYLMASVKNTYSNSSVIFRVSSVTFLKYWDYSGS